MAGTVPQTGPIAVLGATGFTGSLTAQELQRRGADVLLIDEDGGKLAALSEGLQGVPFATALPEDTIGLGMVLEPCAVAVLAGGPYAEALVAAAAETGTHYVDTVSDQAFIQLVLDRYGEQAASTGVAVVTAMGCVFGDLLAALTAAGMGPLDEISLALCVDEIQPTRGTALASLNSLAGADLVWDGGRLRPGSWWLGGGRWRFPDPVGKMRAARRAGGEHITVPRHVQTERVRTVWSSSLCPPCPGCLSAYRLLVRTPLRRRFEASLRRRTPETLDEWTRRKARFMFDCEARAGGRTRRGTLQGYDLYGLTATVLTDAALICAAPGFDKRGALSPAEAFEPGAFLDALPGAGLSYEVEPLPALAGGTDNA